MIGLITMARQSPIIRLVVSAIGGLLAGVAFYAWNKKLDKRHRREIAAVGGVSTAIIIWLLLGSKALAGGDGQIPGVSLGDINVPAGTGYDFPFSLTADGVPNYNYDPSLIFANPPKEQTATTCGCAERASMWGAYIQNLWQVLDETLPQGPGESFGASNFAGVPSFAG